MRLEDILPPEEAGEVPRCTEGARACPPEDVGGVLGYEEIIESLDAPSDDASDDEWGDPFDWSWYDPEAVDLDHVNERLGRIAPKHMRAAKRAPKESSHGSGASLAPPAIHRQAERTMRAIQRLIDEREFDGSDEANDFLESLMERGLVPEFDPGDDPLVQAQDVVDRAFDASSREEAERMAREALALSPDCADA